MKSAPETKPIALPVIIGPQDQKNKQNGDLSFHGQLAQAANPSNHFDKTQPSPSGGSSNRSMHQCGALFQNAALQISACMRSKCASTLRIRTRYVFLDTDVTEQTSSLQLIVTGICQQRSIHSNSMLAEVEANS
jgi:hypothetical protein